MPISLHTHSLIDSIHCSWKGQVRLLKEIISANNKLPEKNNALRIKKFIERGHLWKIILDHIMNFLNHMFQSLVLNFKNQSRCKLRTEKIIKRSHLLVYFQLFSRSLRVLPYNNSSNCSSPLLIEAYPTKSIIIFDNHFRTSPQPKLKIIILSLLRSLNIKIPQQHALKKVVIVKACFKVQSSYQPKIQITCLDNKNK